MARPSSWSSCKFEDTKLIRIPIKFADYLLTLAHQLERGENLTKLSKFDLQEQVRRIVASSRSRDRAIVRRAFAELLAISEDDLK
jgi:hypothetical protein